MGFNNPCYDDYCWTLFYWEWGGHSPENNIHHNTQNTLWGNKPMIVRVTLSDPPLLKPLKMLKMLKLVKGGM